MLTFENQLNMYSEYTIFVPNKAQFKQKPRRARFYQLV